MSRYYNDGLYAVDTSTAELKHFGIIGQKWGIRRYQNPDGTLTPEGIVRYAKKDAMFKIRAAKLNKDLFGL